MLIIITQCNIFTLHRLDFISVLFCTKLVLEAFTSTIIGRHHHHHPLVPSKMSTISVITPDPEIDLKISNHEVELTIPEGAELLEHQVAGHRFGFSKHKLGLLRHSSSRDILKPICDKRSERECRFYELVFDQSNEKDLCVRKLSKLVPKYNGLFYDARMKVNYIRLADLTIGLKGPSVLDMKMGKITYDPEASEVKRKSELSKYRYATELGFRILGMRIFDRSSKKYIVKDKDYGVQVTPDNASKALLTFVQNEPCLVAQFHQQLTEIRRWFREVNIHRWKFISSSLFFVYGEVSEQPCLSMSNHDHDHRNHLENNHHDDHDPRYRGLIKMIDFAHVFPNEKTQERTEVDSSIDQNYLFGLDKLDHYLQQAANELIAKS